MTCRFESPPRDAWSALLELRRWLTTSPGDGPCAAFVETSSGWRLRLSPPWWRGDERRAVVVRLRAAGEEEALETRPEGVAVAVVDERGIPEPDGAAALPAFLAVYLPVVLGGRRARSGERPFVTGHLAQTLDGRIAARTGHSQWIGNEANLHHAHRLRALHDAVLVGAETALRDDPRLTVRHVEGRDPARVVVSGRARVLAARDRLRLFRAPGCTVVHSSSMRASTSGVDAVRLQGVDGTLDPRDLCRALLRRGWRSVFVEGGGRTLSSLLAAGCVDLLHVHVAPRILGSGVSSFVLPAVENVAESLALEAQHYSMDGELLWVCRPRP